MKGGVLASGEVTLSHPTAFNRNVTLPGLRLRVVQEPGAPPWDLLMRTFGLHSAGRACMLLENILRKGVLRAPRDDIENLLVAVLNASAGKALNDTLVNKVAHGKSDVTVYKMQDMATAARAKTLGITSVPAVVIDGKLAACCSGRGIDEAVLRTAGLGG